MTSPENCRTFRALQQKRNLLKALVVLVVFFVLLWAGYYILALTALVLSYVIHELLWSDHIFYDPRQDYSYNLLADNKQLSVIVDDVPQLPAGLNQDDTHVIEVNVKTKITGCFLDPYVDMIVGEGCPSGKQKKSVRQYFERRVDGVRFLNISHLLENSHDKLRLVAHHCSLDSSIHILSFVSPLSAKKKVMVIAPHADDAEIAAFCFYSRHESCVVTLTAGEIEAEYYEPVITNKAEASRLKGRLRAWDSIVVPKWGGVRDGNAMQLGYFCLTLEQMYAQKEVAVRSRTADLGDTRYFRNFNPQKLKSDQDCSPTWKNLVQDLVEMMQCWQPNIIITPHPGMDSHKDHRYATLACLEAYEKSSLSPCCFLLYANHYACTDMFPFGVSGSVASLPPAFDSCSGVKVFSFPADEACQREKLGALTMMHDLNTPIRLKRKIRQVLQHVFLGRDARRYGDDDYFRKAIRHNELFFQVDAEQLKKLIEAGQPEAGGASHQG